MKLVNLNQHPVVIMNENHDIIATIEPSGMTCRVASTIIDVEPMQVQLDDGSVVSIPCTRTEYGEVEGLPDAEEGVVYITSHFTITALKEKGIHRPDVISPNTNPSQKVIDVDGTITGRKGSIIGVLSLQLQ